jgi:hypothetical protein
MDQLGHANAAFTLAVYRHGMRRDGNAKQQLRELVGRGEPVGEDVGSVDAQVRPVSS